MGSLRFTIPAMLCHAKKKCTDGKTRRVPGPPSVPKLVGYYTNGKSPNFDRAREYSDWKDHVLAEVKALGIKLPEPTKERPVRLDTYPFYPSGTSSDSENVRKGVCDSLYRHGHGGGDKWVYGYHHFPQFDKKNPRLEVEITWKD